MPEQKQDKAIPLEDFELKETGDGWEFTAYASTFGNKDHGGDVIDRKAFDATLKARPFRPLLWHHHMDQVIGVEKSLRSDGHGLLGTWTLMRKGIGEYAYEALKIGAVRAMSIGYIPEAWEWKDEGTTRLLKSIDLLENSVVSIPMNEDAVVTGVKRHVINIEAPFEDLIGQVKAAVGVGADEAEALFSRRADEERELSQAHIDALVLLAEELKGSQARIDAILSQARTSPAPKGNEVESLLVRLALHRARTRARRSA